jgi:methyl-accepting chemotaxis protein
MVPAIRERANARKIGNIYFADFAAVNNERACQETMTAIVTGIKDAAAEITRTSRDIAQANQQLARRAEEGSRRIEEILGVIDGVAFESNILALNAAIESGRAADAGRGIAEVADEIRLLVERSAAATREIRALVSDTLGRYDSGATLVAEIGRTMDEITRSMQQATALMTEFAAPRRPIHHGEIRDILRRPIVPDFDPDAPQCA